MCRIQLNQTLERNMREMVFEPVLYHHCQSRTTLPVIGIILSIPHLDKLMKKKKTVHLFTMARTEYLEQYMYVHMQLDNKYPEPADAAAQPYP
jgi:hypothetical protein